MTKTSLSFVGLSFCQWCLYSEWNENMGWFIKALYEILIICLEGAIEVLTVVCPHNSQVEVNTIGVIF